jgi:hypothetical protein
MINDDKYDILPITLPVDVALYSALLLLLLCSSAPLLLCSVATNERTIVMISR